MERLVEALVRVVVVAADVSQRTEVAGLLSVCAEMGPLRGIVHSAGSLADGVILQQTWDRFRAPLGPKVDGTWALHELTEGARLDFFILYSSIAATLGASGQANHAAANAFMDALAMHIYARDVVRARTRPALFVNTRDYTMIERLPCHVTGIAGSLDPLAIPSVAAQGELLMRQRPDGTFTWFEGEPGEEGPWLTVWGPDGNVLHRTRFAEWYPIDNAARLAREADDRIVAVPSTNSTFRVLSGRSRLDGRPVVIQVARSESSMRLEFRELVLFLALGLPLAFVVAGAGGYFMARHALAPVERMAERGVTVVHTTVLRWVQHFVPAFVKKWKNYARLVGSSWRVDETYIKVKGQWRYLYRAVDKQGQTVDFLLSKNRDRAAAVRFFKKAVSIHAVPEKITLDGSQASHQAVAELKAEGALPAQTLVRTNKYLNNIIEQDHRRVKQRCYPMLGFKTFGNAEVTLSGSELANKIKKGQFDTSEAPARGPANRCRSNKASTRHYSPATNGSSGR